MKTRLQSVLKVAMEEKQKTLRPEIQLLNRLLAVETSAERKQARRMPRLSAPHDNLAPGPPPVDMERPLSEASVLRQC